MSHNKSSAAKLLQSCSTLCDSRDVSTPGSPVPGILQARTLEWVAISFSKSSGTNLNRISALGADGGAEASSLSLREMYYSPFLVYKTSIIDILQRLFILGGYFQ